MSKLIKEYLSLLKKELLNSDRATIQDALADAEEHFALALEAELENQPEAAEEDLLPAIIEDYGSPEETAAAYFEIESRVRPALSYASQSPEGLLAKFFGIYADPKAWGSMLYMLISILTGTLYFSWVVTGFSTSASFALFIFGLPVAVLFMFSQL